MLGESCCFSVLFFLSLHTFTLQFTHFPFKFNSPQAFSLTGLGIVNSWSYRPNFYADSAEFYFKVFQNILNEEFN
jgi:hypothetical protein